ncbi:hypothetical protein HD806DRAFT_153245 [Xylariaceae sp. AK1471]|nr:hypothetical protein HD806DRAFT_153245 [Xylariaceae sp. AK1471]
MAYPVCFVAGHDSAIATAQAFSSMNQHSLPRLPNVPVVSTRYQPLVHRRKCSKGNLYRSSKQRFLGSKYEQLLSAVEVSRLEDIVVLYNDYFIVPNEQLNKLKSILLAIS